MNLTQEETKMLSDFLNRCEQLPEEVAVFADKMKDEVVRLADEAIAAVEAEAARIDGMSDAEVIAEAQATVEAAPADVAPSTEVPAAEVVADTAALSEAPAEAVAEEAVQNLELAPEMASEADGIGEAA